MNAQWVDQEIHAATQHYIAGRLGPAADAFQRILNVQPEHFQALLGLSEIAHRLGRFELAASLSQQALRVNPDSHTAAFNCGISKRAMGKFEEAANAFKRALAINPGHVETHCSLGNCLRDLDRPEESLAAYEKAVRVNPCFAPAQNSLGLALADVGRYEEALVAQRKAVRLDPLNAHHHWNLAGKLLQLEDRQGWDEFEWRWKFDRYAATRPSYPQPVWAGEPLNGKTIFIHPEQGLGDSLLFARYAPLVTTTGAKVLLGCQTVLETLFKSLAGVDRIYAHAPTENFDLQCPLQGLPFLLNTRFHFIPPAPYLAPSETLLEKWKKALPPTDGKFRVGLCWCGGASERRRAMRLSQLNPLAKVEGIQFYSLQKGPSDTHGAALNIIDFTEQFTDFAETAALIRQLDLVITVDTAVAHLAGAIGAPVWVLLMANPDWRWFLKRDDSPWYPTMRLFRQSQLNQWDDVIERVALALDERRN